MDEGNPYRADDASKLAGDVFGGKLGVQQALEKLRQRLLDLTLRNKLLNYKSPKGRSFQFTSSPDLDLVYERLEEGKAVGLAYVPDPPTNRYDNGKKPDVRTYARELGIGTSVDVPKSTGSTAYKRLQDLQVLNYPADLERAARKIASEARTVIEETGANMLYLMFGYLEYFDSEDSERTLHAPLLSMPVALNRGNIDPETRTYLYELTHTGEDVTENVTLREKLRSQFRMELPDLDDEDTPDAYFAKIEKAVSKRKNWVVRRRLTLGFLSFGKLAIWKDLDPANGPALLESPLLKNIFEGGHQNTETGFHAEDYAIDEHADGELPLIYDADSSQHSALIDVKNGKNLVINGPPGTGKSQTITNIIATAIAQGKKVLFVSEKLAALEVVKQRLEAAGLGDFCLELHSHKTQKKQLLANIEDRMSKRYRAPVGYEKHVKVLRERRNVLNRYAALLGSREGNLLDMTIHEVLWTTERKRQALNESTAGVAGLQLKDPGQWTAERIDKTRNILGDASSALAEMGHAPKESPWLGYSPRLLIKGDEVPILKTVESALTAARKTEAAVNAVAISVGGMPWSLKQMEAATSISELLPPLFEPVNEQLLAQMFALGIGQLDPAKREARRLSASLERIRSLQAVAEKALSRPGVVQPEVLADVATQALRTLNAKVKSQPIEEVEPAISRLDQLVEALRISIEGKETQVPSQVPQALVRFERYLKDDAGQSRCDEAAAGLERQGAEAQQVLKGIEASLDQVTQLLAEARIPFTGKTDELRQLVSGTALTELQPGATTPTAAHAALRDLASRGWAEWTAGQFTETSGHIQEVLGESTEALEEVRSLFGRLGLPLDTSKAALEALAALIAVAESAPKELLYARTEGYARADFSDEANAAEHIAKDLISRHTKIEQSFHLDVLPDVETLKRHVAVFRQGDGFFNFLKSDWRQAKAAFKTCSKSTTKLDAARMAERFTAIVSWTAGHAAFESESHMKQLAGSLFQGTKTEFEKIRRLHKWVRESHDALLPTQLASVVNVATWSEANFTLLAASGPKIHIWLSKLAQLARFVKELPGFDPALLRSRKVDELLKPLEEYSKQLLEGASALKTVARPTASVQRAIELIELAKHLDERKDLLNGLVVAPTALAKLAGTFALPDNEFAYQDLRPSLGLLLTRARHISEMGDSVRTLLGPDYSVRQAAETLACFEQAAESVGELFQAGAASGGQLYSLVEHWQSQLKNARAIDSYVSAVGEKGVSIAEVLDGSRAYLDALSLLDIVASDKSFRDLFGPVLNGVDSDESAIAQCIQRAETISLISSSLPTGTANRLLDVGASSKAMALRQALSDFVQSFGAYKDEMMELAGWGALDWLVWGGSPFASDAVARLELALSGGQSLIAWSKYLSGKDIAKAAGVSDILLRVERGDVKPDEAVAAFEYVYFRSLSREAFVAHVELARFSGAGHEQLRREFAELDKELISLNGQLYAAQVDGAKKPIPGVASGRVGDLTEMALLTKEVKKQKQHIPIRQLLLRAGRSLLELKPCFMMGPLSVAQYLKQGMLNFDLVVMDEASQLRPEDALGAIARGKQLVVVGDPKQLPPTSFFDRLMEDDEDDPDDAPSVVEGVESVLGICEHLYRPVRTLRWHYRSKHESLISFSNSQFYDHRLVVFPSPYERNRRLGVNYRYVKEGLYKDRRNAPEAQRVVDAVVQHILISPEESLGVVTLNQTQRSLIEDMLDVKVRGMKEVAAYFERHEKGGWPFFVKNLENVQGDERDVIFISTTFGKPGPGEVVRQGFGPINRADGWRRLNVLFTRARRRIDLFTSLQPGDVRLDDKASLGKKALQDYLTFASTGRLPGIAPTSSGREADSDFEVAVSDALRLRGYETEPQVGVAGYFIDLGVRHPERRTEYLAGIECDGVLYHSSLSARDRDRIRQEVLESLGWHGRFIRIWSTDWFADPQAQTDRLVKFLEARRAEGAVLPGPYSDEDLVLADEYLEQEAAADEAKPVIAESGQWEATSNDAGQLVQPRLFIDIGDRVIYETLNPAERHTVTIVDSASNLKLGLLSDKTPLAEALLGLCAGDDAELRVKEQPLRRVRVVRVERQVEGRAVVEGEQ